jgi:exodeoxyribonuclease V beta subunit
MPPDILVMTFTRAATRELSDRIRARLIEAVQCFRGEAEPAAHDSFLRDLRDAYAEGSSATQLPGGWTWLRSAWTMPPSTP